MSPESGSAPNRPDQQGPIAVYGATGYTGKLITSELDRAGADFLLAGRNREKLDQVAAGLGSEVEVRAVSLDDQAGLQSLLEGCSTVIACAGPFHLHGEPVMRAAVETRTHYLDTTGEQPFMRLAWERYDRPASEAGVAVIPAMGFDYVPGDMIASLTAAGMGELDTLRLAYRARMQPTRGTMLSALEMIKGGDVEWRDGRFQPAPQSVSRGSFDFGPPIGELKMTRYPAGEHVTVPHHVSTRRVETMLSADSFAPGAAANLLPAIFRGAGLAMRTPLRALTAKLIPKLPEGASAEARAESTFVIGCEAVAGTSISRGEITGSDVYGLTAALIVKGALIAASGGITASGALAPSQAFEPESFLRDFERFSLEWRVTPPA
ncbi:MAG: saccharopine dehydrogenase NADP-binding domain-containing protein [Solirubrobacterales bacterium]